MQENKNPTPEQQTQKPSLWRRCQQKIKDWRWGARGAPRPVQSRHSGRGRAPCGPAAHAARKGEAAELREEGAPVPGVGSPGGAAVPGWASAACRGSARRCVRSGCTGGSSGSTSAPACRRASTSSGCTRRSFSGAPWPSRPSRSCSRCTRSAHPSAMTALTSGRFRGAASSAAPSPSSRASRARRWATRRIRSIPRGSRRRRGSSRASSSRAARTSSTT